MNSDIIYCILTLLDHTDILKCGLVNKEFNMVTQNELIWKPICESTYPEIKNEYCASYKKYYTLRKFLKLCWSNFEGNLIISNFRVVTMCSRNLSRIPSAMGMMTNLRELDLGCNMLETIPIEIFSLTKLERLSLNSNRFRSIPTEIGSLINLRYLDIFSNKLTFIPKEIGFLTSLQRLAASTNNFESIPEEIGLLTKLQYISLYNNRYLNDIPKSVTRLTNLNEIRVHDYQKKLFPLSMSHIVKSETH